MAKTKDSMRETVFIRMDAEMRREVEKVAAKEDRTLSDQVRNIIRKFLEDRKEAA